MKLIVEVTDTIDRIGGEPTDFRVSSYLNGNATQSIHLSDKNYPHQIKTAQRLDDLAKRIEDVVKEYYSSMETPSVSAN